LQIVIPKHTGKLYCKLNCKIALKNCIEKLHGRIALKNGIENYIEKLH
jgi:hypothetical protein